MAEKTLKVEAADCGFRINVHDSEIYSYLEDRFKYFLSNKKSSYVIDIVDDFIFSSEININENNPLDIDVVNDDDRIVFCAKSIIPLKLGYIDLESKKGVFINRSLELSQQCLMPFLRAAFQLCLFTEGKFLVHACGIEKNDGGYLFVGPSGAGKTTIANLCCNDNVISDEFIYLGRKSNQYIIYSTPWDGRKKKTAVLNKIFFPRKAKMLKLKRIKSALAIEEILVNIIYSCYTHDGFQNILTTLTSLTKSIPCFLMHFSLTSPFWQVITHDS